MTTDFEKYGSGSTSVSSGVSFNYLRDTRDNPINAYRGNYTNFLLIPRLNFWVPEQTGLRWCWNGELISGFLRVQIIFLPSGVITGLR